MVKNPDRDAIVRLVNDAENDINSILGTILRALTNTAAQVAGEAYAIGLAAGREQLIAEVGAETLSQDDAARNFQRGYDAGREQEREACAVRMERIYPGENSPQWTIIRRELAIAIRARGKEKP